MPRHTCNRCEASAEHIIKHYDGAFSRFSSGHDEYDEWVCKGCFDKDAEALQRVISKVYDEKEIEMNTNDETEYGRMDESEQHEEGDWYRRVVPVTKDHLRAWFSESINIEGTLNFDEYEQRLRDEQPEEAGLYDGDVYVEEFTEPLPTKSSLIDEGTVKSVLFIVSYGPPETVQLSVLYVRAVVDNQGGIWVRDDDIEATSAFEAEKKKRQHNPVVLEIRPYDSDVSRIVAYESGWSDYEVFEAEVIEPEEAMERGYWAPIGDDQKIDWANTYGPFAEVEVMSFISNGSLTPPVETERYTVFSNKCKLYRYNGKWYVKYSEFIG